MATTYDIVNRNKAWSIGLIISFAALIVLIGWFIGLDTESGYFGVGIAATFATFSTLGAYLAGDKIALSTSGAKGPITKADNDYLWNLIENLCIATGTPMPKLYIINDPS